MAVGYSDRENSPENLCQKGTNHATENTTTTVHRQSLATTQCLIRW